MSEQHEMHQPALELRAPFASMFEDGAQMLKLPLSTTLRVQPREVLVTVSTRGGDFVVSHSDGPVTMQLGLLSGANIVVSDGKREVHIQFPGWKFKKVANAIRDAGFDVKATGILGRQLPFDANEGGR